MDDLNVSGLIKQGGGNEAMDILKATIVGDEREVKKCIGTGDNIERSNEHGMSALMIAAKKGHLGILQLLLDSGANPNQPPVQDWTALRLAIENEHEDSADLLLSSGANPDVTGDITYITPSKLAFNSMF